MYSFMLYTFSANYPYLGTSIKDVGSFFWFFDTPLTHISQFLLMPVAKCQPILTPSKLLMSFMHLLVADSHFAPQNTFLLDTFCRLCFLKHFAPQHILLPRTFCSLAHFSPRNILLLCKMFSATYFALWNTKSKVF